VAGPALRVANAGETAGVYCHRDIDSRAGYRRQYCNFQRHQRRAPAALPYPHRTVSRSFRERTNIFDSGSVSLPNYLDWRVSQRGFTDLALFRRDDTNLSGAASDVEAERVGSLRVTYNFLSILAVPPELGRDFRESDDVPHCKKVALISEELWKRRFGASHDVIGQSVMLDGVQREIIGVVPSNVQLARKAQVYIPLEDLRRTRIPGSSAIILDSPRSAGSNRM
jgi:hypothetical protein